MPSILARRDRMSLEDGLELRLLSALEAGHRVQLKQLRDGTIKIQVVFQKELKIT